MRLVAFAVVGALPLVSLFAPQDMHALKAFRDGCWLYTRQQFSEAMTQFERAVQLDPDNAEAWFYLGNANQAATNPLVRDAADVEKQARAREAYARAVRGGLGGSSRTKELQAEALAALARSLAADPNPDGAAAVASAEQLVRELPGDARAQHVLARTYEDLGRHPEAEAAYRKLTDSHPNDPLVCDVVADFRRRGMPWDRQMDALPAFERCAALRPEDPTGYYKVAVVSFEVALQTVLLDDTRRGALADKGLAAVNRALALRRDYQDALIYKMALLRLKGLTTRDLEVRLRYEEEAVGLARALQEQRAAVPR